MRRPPPPAADAPAIGAAALAPLMAAAGLPFGLERSARLRPGRLEGRRVLLTQARGAFGAAAWASLRDGVARLGLPAEAWEPGAGRAAFLHLGAEEDAARAAVLKLYLERAVGPGDGEGTLVHEAWKWRPGEAARRHRYTHLPEARAAERLAALARGAGALGEIARALAAWLPPGRPPLGLDVGGEPPRRSLDLNLYPLEARIADLAPVLAAAEAALRPPPGAVAALLEERGGERLGHVALGLDEGGAAFLTVYGGARSVRPGQGLAPA